MEDIAILPNLIGRHFAKQTAFALALCVLGSTLGGQAQAQDEQVARMRTALASPARPAEDKERDAVRKPVETVQFLGIKTGQTVIDVIAAGGWFTEVLSAAVGPSGKVLGQNPDFFVQRDGFVAAEKTRLAVGASLAAGDVTRSGDHTPPLASARYAATSSQSVTSMPPSASAGP